MKINYEIELESGKKIKLTEKEMEELRVKLHLPFVTIPYIQPIIPERLIYDWTVRFDELPVYTSPGGYTDTTGKIVDFAI